MIITLQFSNGNNRGIVVKSETTIEEIRNSFLIDIERHCDILHNGHILSDTVKISDILELLPESNTIPPLLIINNSVNAIDGSFNDYNSDEENRLLNDMDTSEPPNYDPLPEEQITISLKFLNGNTKTIQIGLDKYIYDIKKKYLFVNDDNIDDVKLIHSGRILNNNQKISSLCFTSNSFIVVLTSSKSILDKISQENLSSNNIIDFNDDSCSNSDEMEQIDGDLFEDSHEDEVEIVDNKETILKNNEKFLKLMKDDEFKILVNIILNKPDYISYALTFVQSGMIFSKPDNDDCSDYSEQCLLLKELNICSDEEKLIKILKLVSGDLQMAIRYLFQSQYDDTLLNNVQ